MPYTTASPRRMMTTISFPTGKLTVLPNTLITSLCVPITGAASMAIGAAKQQLLMPHGCSLKPCSPEALLFTARSCQGAAARGGALRYSYI